MQLTPMSAATPASSAQAQSAAGRDGVPVMQIDGSDLARNETAPMRVFMRAHLGRSSGYGSLQTALSAARNISRGDARPAVIVQRGGTGAYEVREAVWQYFWGRNNPPLDRAPFRHFRFEDGSLSQYTAHLSGRRIAVTAKNWGRSYDGITRWLVDGSKVAEFTRAGGQLF